MVKIRSLTGILTYLIALCGILPLFQWLPIFPRLILVLGVLSGLLQDIKGRWYLKPWMQNVSIVPIFIYYILQYSRNNPVQPVISLLAIMLALRLCGEKTVRYSLQIYALSTFCLASSSLFDLSPIFLIYIGFLLFLVAIALVLLTFQSQDAYMLLTIPDLKKIIFTALVMPILAVPLLLLFFPLLPRTQMPLWHFLTPPSLRTTGYSESVEPGSQSSITESNTLAFRAETVRLQQSQLYWRGTVFNRTDGNKWSRNNKIPSEQALFSGNKIAQIIYPEPSATRTIITLDRPSKVVMQHISILQDGVFEFIRAVRGRVSYSVESQSDGLIRQKNKINRQFYLQLPDNLSVRIKNLALQITSSGGNDRAKIDLIENYFRNGNYRYSMRDLPVGENAVENFLFDKKQGHCEFFASSYAILLRSAGIPCRLVGGFLGGEYNNIGGYYIVTDANAHVWVEVYVADSGWLRVDPSSYATNAGDLWKHPEARSIKLRIALMLDSFNYIWNRSVISYDFDQQINIVNRVSSRLHGFDPSKFLRDAVPYLVSTFLAAVLFFALKTRSLIRTREERLLHRFLKIIEVKFNIPINEGRVGLFEIAAAADHFDVSDFINIYAGAVYHDRKLTDSEYALLQQILLRVRS